VRGFVDETTIHLASGRGGAGSISFRREKYIPRGGPDGGDGGKGGDVVFVVRNNLRTLSHLRGHRQYKGENGHPGMGKKRHGKNGEDVQIPVPPGTLLRGLESDRIIKDFTAADEPWTMLRGGRGGRGNWFFRGPIRRAPRFAQPGESGEKLSVRLELNLIADAGFVGMPNAGKSTLLSVLTHARPRVAAYPFTTLVPYLGVMTQGDSEIVLADIPGIIEGASEGAGLGIQFLKHISRSAVLVFMADASDEGCAEAIGMLRSEVVRFSEELAHKRSIVVATKLDILGAEDNLRALAARLAPEPVLGISAVTGAGIPELRARLLEMAAPRPKSWGQAGEGVEPLPGPSPEARAGS
jgi:GTP-binding protein